MIPENLPITANVSSNGGTWQIFSIFSAFNVPAWRFDASCIALSDLVVESSFSYISKLHLIASTCDKIVRHMLCVVRIYASKLQL